VGAARQREKRGVWADPGKGRRAGPEREERKWVDPQGIVYFFYFFKIFFKQICMDLVKNVLPLLENFQVKHGCAGN
jgi:hypothetical protein